MDSGEPHIHWHLQIRPRLTTPVGFEMGTEISINPSLPENDAAFLNEIEGSRGIIFWGAHAPPRAGDGALAIANFLPITHFGEGAEMCTRGRVRSPD